MASTLELVASHVTHSSANWLGVDGGSQGSLGAMIHSSRGDTSSEEALMVMMSTDLYSFLRVLLQLLLSWAVMKQLLYIPYLL